MPEGAHGYPRWDGLLHTGPAFPLVAAQELRRARNNVWTQYTFILVVAFTVVYLGSLFQLSQSRGDVVHTLDNFLSFLNILPWGALALAAVVSGPSLLEDARHSALELYLSRAVTKRDYLLGKVLAVFGVTSLAIIIPALLYFGVSYVFFDQHPEGWHLVPLKFVAYALMWAALAAGLGMGLSCVSRSSRAATLILFAGIVVTDRIVVSILEGITRDGRAQVLSPFSALVQQTEWLFGVAAPFEFPTWWGLLVWAGLSTVGWGLVVWKHPRLRGD